MDLNKTIMIVAAGFGQLPAIVAAKKMGLKVIAVDRDPKALGMQYADVSLSLDVTDIEGIIKAALKHNIDGVMTMQSDLPVRTVGAVVDALGLPGVGGTPAENCSNKIKTRKCFLSGNVPQPKFIVVSSVEEVRVAIEELGLPAIIKPPDSSGSRGVTKISNLSEIKPALEKAESYSKIDEILVEEYIDGIELGAQVFSIGGDCKQFFFHNDTVTNTPYMVPIGHSYPVFLDEQKLQIVRESVDKAVSSLGIVDGPSNIDLILDKENNVKIIEIGARIGATCLPELTTYFTGIDWVKATILSALGEIPDLSQKSQKPCAAVVLESPADGKLVRFEIPKIVEEDEDLLEIEITAKIGDEVRSFRKGTDRIGKIFVKGRSAKEAEEKAEFLKSQVKFYVESDS